MGSQELFLTLLAFCFSAFAQEPCSLVTPNILKLESDEMIVLQVHNQHSRSGDITVTITVASFPPVNRISDRFDITLRAENKFAATTKIRVRREFLNKDVKGNQYVSINAKFENLCELNKVVLVSFQTGYIFLQTDKPIYNPGTKVNYRLFTLDYEVQPLKSVVIIEVETPEGIIIKREEMHGLEATHGIVSGTYDLPEVLNEGIWKIVAKFAEDPQKSYSAQFEVKTYVLPTFEVILTPRQNFFYVDNEELEVKIEAQYLHGNPVEGIAFVRFGVQRDDKKIDIPGSLRRVAITEGIGQAILTQEMLKETFKNVSDLLGDSLYVTATILTDSGHDMVEAQKTDIHIVDSPYKILFTKTPTYFKPSFPFLLMVYVTNPDGSPAKAIPLEAEPGAVKVTTEDDGTAKMSINTQLNASELKIKVKTNKAGISEHRQAQKEMTSLAYRSKGASNNYLHVDVPGRSIAKTANLVVNFHLQFGNIDIQNQVREVNYVITNKGKIVQFGQQQWGNQPSIVLNLAITPNLIPSFRIVAYYYVVNNNIKEMVADSVWVDVEDDCVGSLSVTATNKEYRPQERVKLEIKGNRGGKVALVIVDKGVYVLNNKYKLSQTKIWDEVEKNDLGCTAGSGLDITGVFKDAGLALQTNFEITTPTRSELKCPQPSKRRRRSPQILEYKTKKLDTYADELKKCCRDGMYDNPMGHSCEHRAEYIIEGSGCVKAFLDCCNYIKKVREDNKLQDLHLARSDVDEGYAEDDEILVRTSFPESWFWDIKQLPFSADADGISTLTQYVSLHDSITTWELLAISATENFGICVAKPLEIRVSREFFIDLLLPYSIVLHEQVEIRAVLFNYLESDIKVRVELAHSVKFCSASTSKRPYRQEVKIRPTSSVAVSFVIVPLVAGEHDITVKASIHGNIGSDGMTKKLRVLPEGKLIRLLETYHLDPAGGTQEHQVNASEISNIVPKSEPKVVISLQGSTISEVIESSINATNLRHLIQMPGGCGEQNMARMTPTVIVAHFLDHTQQWETIGVERREEVIQIIRKGYVQQLAYRKDDAYGIWPHTAVQSTWLTAYVVKVFAMASDLISIDENVLCGAVRWLVLNKQNPDGIFREDGSVSAGYLVGGYSGSDRDDSLTAFVLIALKESTAICSRHVSLLGQSAKRAGDYLVRRINHIYRPYTVALVHYALALDRKYSNIPHLMSYATGGKFWHDPTKENSIEGTSYALLAFLHLGDFSRAKPLVNWILEQRFFGVSYGSTQATIMVFQALAEYEKQRPKSQSYSMHVSMKLPQRTTTTTMSLDSTNYMLTRRADTTKIPGAFKVQATGTGQGVLTVETLYYQLQTNDTVECNQFNLSVSVKEDPLASVPEGSKRSVRLEICMRYLGVTPSTMTILDVNMLTSFLPDLTQLERLKNGVDQYIAQFEYNKPGTEKNTLIIYLDKVSNVTDECIHIFANQFFDAGLIQPAAVTVYEYYAQANRCTKFYHPQKESGMLDRICKGEVCRCMEDNCYSKPESTKISVDARKEKVCEQGVDYAYKIEVMEKGKAHNYDVYTMAIRRIIKQGSDDVPEGSLRTFISHMSCRTTLDLKIGTSYLTWGLRSDMWEIPPNTNYIIGKDTWLERWPTQDECNAPALMRLCRNLDKFSDSMVEEGCES